MHTADGAQSVSTNLESAPGAVATDLPISSLYFLCIFSNYSPLLLSFLGDPKGGFLILGGFSSLLNLVRPSRKGVAHDPKNSYFFQKKCK